MWMVSPPADWFGTDKNRPAFAGSAAPLMMINPFVAWSAVSVASAAALTAAAQAMGEVAMGRARRKPAKKTVARPTAAPKARPAPVKAVPKAVPVEPAAAPSVSKKVAKPVETAPAAPAPVAAKPAAKSPLRPAGLEAPRAGKADDLKRISGIGPKLEMVLNDLGVYHFDQIAQWSRAEIDWIDDYLQFKGRVDRDKWIEQAGELAGK